MAAGGLGSDPEPLSHSHPTHDRTENMATESKATTTRERKATTARQSKPRLKPAETVLEDNPTDPDNGDPAGWPEWTDRLAYTLTRR